MRISTRLPLIFSIITSSIFILFGTAIYFFSSNYRKSDFQKRLQERVLITEKVFLERDSFTPTEFQKIKDEFLHTLPQETEEVVEIKADSAFVLTHKYPPFVVQNFLWVESNVFEYGEVQGISRIFNVGGKSYLIIVTAIDQIGHQNLAFLGLRIILLILIGIPIIFMGSFFFTRRTLLPISKKIDHANSISASNLHQRLQVFNPEDEIGKLAIAFNHLLDRLETSFELQRSFISNASHEIKNPLTAIIGEAEIAMSKARSSEEYEETLNIILMEAESLNATVNNLLQLSKVTSQEENIQFSDIQFDEFLIEIKESFDFMNPENQVDLVLPEHTHQAGFAISGNRNLLKAAIINLLDNACKFSNNKKVKVEMSKNDKWLSLTIQDQGIGIVGEDLEKIITPFYRGNNALQLKGSGIGLALSDKIVSLHKGFLEIQSEIEIGTRICLKIPLC